MMKEEIIIGRNPVIEALKSGRMIHKILISDQLNVNSRREINRLSQKVNAVIQQVPKHKLNQLSKGNHQGIVAFVASYEYAQLDDLFKIAKERNEDPFFIILDELEDPHNLGSILRTADATGAHGVIIPKRRAVGLTETVAKTSAGAIEYVSVVRVTNIAQTIERLKEKGLWIVGTAGEAKVDYRSLDLTMPLAIVVGNEGKGMSRLVKEKCDWLVKLPMVGHVPSLNASVACSLLLYEVYRKRYPISGKA